MSDAHRSTRREFLGECGALTLGALAIESAATAKSPETVPSDTSRYDCIIPRVQFACDSRVSCPWNIYPGGDVHLLEAFEQTVHCRVKLPQNVRSYQPMFGQRADFGAVADLAQTETLRNYPFLFMTAEGYYTFNAKQKTGLHQYIEEGGFILMDDCVFDRGGDFFYQSSFRLLEELFGPGSVKAIPNDHEVFTNVTDLSQSGLPHAQGTQHGAHGLFVGDRLAVFLSPSDLHCAWTDRERKWFPDPDTHKRAIEMGINILTYALSH